MDTFAELRAELAKHPLPRWMLAYKPYWWEVPPRPLEGQTDGPYPVNRGDKS